MAEGVQLVAQRQRLVCELDHSRIILLREVRLVIQRINVQQQIRVGILGNEIIQQLDLVRGVFFRGRRLVRVVLRHGVRLFAGAGVGILSRGGWRSCQQQSRGNHAQRREHRQVPELSDYFHSHSPQTLL